MHAPAKEPNDLERSSSNAPMLVTSKGSSRSMNQVPHWLMVMERWWLGWIKFGNSSRTSWRAGHTLSRAFKPLRCAVAASRSPHPDSTTVISPLRLPGASQMAAGCGLSTSLPSAKTSRVAPCFGTTTSAYASPCRAQVEVRRARHWRSEARLDQGDGGGDGAGADARGARAAERRETSSGQRRSTSSSESFQRRFADSGSPLAGAGRLGTG